jgi:uncharacterized membrane protein YkoI
MPVVLILLALAGPLQGTPPGVQTLRGVVRDQTSAAAAANTTVCRIPLLITGDKDMKRTGFLMAVAMFAMSSVVFAQAAAPAQKKAAPAAKDHLKDLPPAVRATVEAETKNATIKGVSKEKENGKTVYELESLVNGRTRDLMIDSAGKVYVIEEQLDVDKAPVPVKAAMEAKGKIVVLEMVMENGKTRYEGQVQTKAGKKVAMELDADGKPYKK